MDLIEPDDHKNNSSITDNLILIVEKYSKKVQMVLENYTGIKFYFENDLLNSLRNGIILCRFAQMIFPDIMTRFVSMENKETHRGNLKSFLNAVQTVMQSATRIFSTRDFNEPTMKPDQNNDDYITLKLQKYLNVLNGLAKFIQFLEDTEKIDVNENEIIKKPFIDDCKTRQVSHCHNSDPKASSHVKFGLMQFEECSNQLEELVYPKSGEDIQSMQIKDAKETFKTSTISKHDEPQLSLLKKELNLQQSSDPSSTSTTSINSREMVSAFSEDTLRADNTDEYIMKYFHKIPTYKSVITAKLQFSNLTSPWLSTINNNTNNRIEGYPRNPILFHQTKHPQCTHCTQAQHLHNTYTTSSTNSHYNHHARNSSQCQGGYNDRHPGGNTVIKTTTSVTSMAPNLSTFSVSTTKPPECQDGSILGKQKCIKCYHHRSRTDLLTTYNKSQCTANFVKVYDAPNTSQVRQKYETSFNTTDAANFRMASTNMLHDLTTLSGTQYISQNALNDCYNKNNDTFRFESNVFNKTIHHKLPFCQMSQSNISHQLAPESQEPQSTEPKLIKQTAELESRPHQTTEETRDVVCNSSNNIKKENDKKNKVVTRRKKRRIPPRPLIAFKPVLESDDSHDESPRELNSGNDGDNNDSEAVNNKENDEWGESWSSLHSTHSIEGNSEAIKDYGASLADADSWIYSESDATVEDIQKDDWLSIHVSPIAANHHSKRKNDASASKAQQKHPDNKLTKKSTISRSPNKQKQLKSTSNKDVTIAARKSKTVNIMDVTVDTSDALRKDRMKMEKQPNSIVYLPFQDLQSPDKNNQKRIQLIVGNPQKTNVSKDIIRTDVKVQIFRN